MALQSAYKQFLDAPNPALLAENASLHYITTLVTLNGSAEIIKHLKSQSIQLKKKEEILLDVVEGQNALAIETHTTIEFLLGGGAYLPSLDENFLSDRTATFPITHFVHFNADGRISQIRHSWDQGSLLKLIDVIGKTGRNWPIRDGKDQIKLISNSVKSGDKSIAATNSGGVPQEAMERLKLSRESSANVTRDPHASLSLFAPRDHNTQDSLPAVIAPRFSAKPPQRDYHDLFVGGDSDNSPVEPSFGNVRGRSDSPSKAPAVIAPKGGSGKNYQPNRLFDNDENAPIKKASQTEAAANKSKHGSNWNFDDFNTPAKVVPGKGQRAPDTRHWGNEEDAVLESPIRQGKADKPRKDAETHFQFVDDGTPEGPKRLIGRPLGAGMDSGMGLYQSNLYGDDDGQGAPQGRALGDVTNVKDRRKDFDPHFAMTDDSPIVSNKVSGRLPEDRAQAVKMMEANWEAQDQSPSQKENVSAKALKSNDNPKGISIGGDGMGGKKGAGRSWGFGDDSDGEGGPNGKGSAFRKGVSAKKQGNDTQTSAGGDFWNY